MTFKAISRNSSAGFFGDSIMAGYGAPFSSACWQVFKASTGTPVVEQDGDNPMGFPGFGVHHLRDRINRCMERWQPDVVFVCCGANNMDAGGEVVSPFGWDARALLNGITEILEEIRAAHATPVCLGLPPLEAGGMDQVAALSLNQALEEECIGRNLRFASFLKAMVQHPSWNPRGGDLYGNLAMDIHPNAKGQAFIGRFCAEIFMKITGGQPTINHENVS